MKNQINSTSFDEVDIIMMVNEDCDDMVDKEVDDETIDKIANGAIVDDPEDNEPDEDVADIMYDEQRDDATTIEDMAAEDMRIARDFGFETGFTEVDDDVEDIIYDDDDEDLDDDGYMDESSNYEGGLYYGINIL